MAHSTWKLDHQRSEHEAESHALVAEKLGVIAGFLVGLAVGLGLVAEPLTAAELPQWLALPATVLTVALFTWVGHRVGTLAAERVRRVDA